MVCLTVSQTKMEGKNVYHNKVFSSHKPEIEPITMTLKKAGRTATTSETEAYLLIQQGNIMYPDLIIFKISQIV